MSRTVRRKLFFGSLILGLVACAAPMTVPTTGLTGTVSRGPITPVCRVDVPCSAPFSARFDVKREGSTVAIFQSDSQGIFTVMLSPATYTIAPEATGPTIGIISQTKTVVVGPVGLTTVQLEFDTGIR